MKTVLTIEESAKLIELGVDAKLASGRYFADVTPNDGESFLDVKEYPIFTLTDILAILPKEIHIHRGGDTLSMMYHHNGKWYVGYTNVTDFCEHTKVAPELIDALYQLLIWVLENKKYNPKNEEK